MCGIMPICVYIYMYTEETQSSKGSPVFPPLCTMFSAEQGLVLKRTEEQNMMAVLRSSLMAVLHEKSVPHLSLGRATPNCTGYLRQDFGIIKKAKVAGI